MSQEGTPNQEPTGEIFDVALWVDTITEDEELGPRLDRMRKSLMQVSRETREQAIHELMKLNGEPAELLLWCKHNPGEKADRKVHQARGRAYEIFQNAERIVKGEAFKKEHR